MGFWAISITEANVPQLSFASPFQHLGIFFWVGLSIIVVNILIGNQAQKILSVVILMAYFIVTLSVIFDYPVMHDSVMNTAYSSTSQGSFAQYGKTYLGMGFVLNFIQSIFGRDYFQIARYFPLGVGIVYLMIFGLFYYSWRGILFSSFFSFCLFALFIFAFGETFYLRINASPQT
jgi:hypothetical protein